jgi:hypothetical protein
MYLGGAYFLYKDVFDRTPTVPELLELLKDLDPVETLFLLCKINADLRLCKREKQAAAKLQQELAGALLDDETVARFKARFGSTNMADRPVFHIPQILNVVRLVVQYSGGAEKIEDPATRYKLGTACLMMNDLMVTAEEQLAIASGSEEDRMRNLMTQMLGPFEVSNTAAITHIAYRSRIMFHLLLNDERVIRRIARECQGFDFSRQFSGSVGIPLSRWLFLLFGFYAYFSNYLDPGGVRHQEFITIDRTKFCGESKITQADLDVVFKTVSVPLDVFKQMLNDPRPTEWRFDFVPFKARPLIEVQPGKFLCPDIGFLIEKMHSGVYWAVFEGLTEEQRPMLFKAWGILFEEYVNWFSSGRMSATPALFHSSPSWADGTECFDGALIQDSRFVPMEYKGGFLKIEARYSGNPKAFEADLDLKIGEGCDQLAWKIGALFDADPAKRKKLKDIPLTHVTRVIPILVVQDHILRGPLVNWHINRLFNSLLDRTQLRSDVVVDPLNLVGIHELESMVESAGGGHFDLLHGLQLRCFRDPDMRRSELHNFLMTVPGYGEGKSERVEKILDEQWDEIEACFFGKQDTTQSSCQNE